MGASEFKSNTHLKEEDILDTIPKNKDIVWIRDEGHIKTNNFYKVLENICWKIINFSATNKYADIKCNFTHTLMLRTVVQNTGTPEQALDMLVSVKNQHKNVHNYNPCAIFRIIHDDIKDRIIKACIEKNLAYIDISNDEYDMVDLCRDDNKYDVIINKQKLTEGIDIRRAHVLYMDSEPGNSSTTIQAIGRCRRNALLYRNDINILASKNKKLLQNTRRCYVFYNVRKMSIDTDENGELCNAFCDKISCQQLKENTLVEVKNGVMLNGLTIIELEGLSGKYNIKIDKRTGLNIVNASKNSFYKKKKISTESKYVWIPRFYSTPIRKDQGSSGYLAADKYNIDQIKELYNQNLIEYQNSQELLDNLKPVNSVITRFGTKGLIENIKKCNKHVSQTQLDALLGYDLKDKSVQPILNLINEVNPYVPYNKIINDKESAIIGTDFMHYNKKLDKWVEQKAITAKIDVNSKLDSFISRKYADVLNNVRPYLYNRRKNIAIDFSKKCNSCLGYCVEYYGKYLAYGQPFLGRFIQRAQKELGTNCINEYVIVRACMLKYKGLMSEAFCKETSKLIRTISVTSLIKAEYKNFVNMVVKLGKRVCYYIKNEFNTELGYKLYDPNLSIQHIAGLADVINDTQIGDIKCTGTITEKFVKQVLAYHYLSTKRDDLNVQYLSIFDAINNKVLRIDLNSKKVTLEEYKNEIEKSTK